MEEIRSWFEVPAIAHYCYLFRAAFDLTEFEIEDFEDALVVDGSYEGTSFIPDLLARLLRGLYRTKDVSSHNYERYLNDLLDYHYVYLEKKENPVKEIPFKNLPTKKKVEILYDICHWRLEVDDIQELLKNNEPEQIRVQPIGKDSKGALYWYFYGTCLYKEESLEKPVLNGLVEENGRNCVKMKGKKRKKKGKGRKLKSAKKKKKDKWYSDSDSDVEFDSSMESSDDDKVYTKKGSVDTAEDEDAELQLVPFHGKSRWSLLCSSAEDWQQLADSFEGSKHKAEKAFYKLLVEEYIEQIPKIIESKERALQKKLLQEAPRRASDRIAFKLQQQEEEERVRDLIWKEEEERRQKEAEERKKHLEEQRKKERDERARERERLAEERRIERERRAKQREEQKWAIENPELAHELKKVVEESKGEEKDGDRMKRLKSESGEKDEDEYTAMFKVLDAVKKHKDAWPFIEPVDESYAPQYYDIIEKPMDLSKIEEKLEKSQYASKEEFVNDMELIFDNCLEYNGEESCYTKMANAVDRAFRKHLTKEFPEDMNDSNDEDYYEDTDENRKKKKGKKDKGKGSQYSEQEIRPNLGPEPQLFRPGYPDGKIPVLPMSHGTTPNDMFPPPSLRPANPPGPILPSEIVRAQMMQQQIRLLTAMNGVLRPGAGGLPTLRPRPEGTPAAFPPGLTPHLGQLAGPMASLIGQFTRMPINGNKNIPVNPHHLGERANNPANLTYGQRPLFQGMIPPVSRLETPQMQAPPHFRMIFPPQAETGAPNPRAFALDQLLARSTAAEKPSSTTSTVKTTHFAPSQLSTKVRKGDEKPENNLSAAEEEKDNPLSRKISLEESNARVQSWLDSQPEMFECNDQAERSPCTETATTATSAAPTSTAVVSSVGVAAAVAASIHNAVKKSMRAGEKQEGSHAGIGGSVMYKKNGFINLSKQGIQEVPNATQQAVLGKEVQGAPQERSTKEAQNATKSKPQFFVYQEGKQPVGLLSPLARNELSNSVEGLTNIKPEPENLDNVQKNMESATSSAIAGARDASPINPTSARNGPLMLKSVRGSPHPQSPDIQNRFAHAPPHMHQINNLTGVERIGQTKSPVQPQGVSSPHLDHASTRTAPSAADKATDSTQGIKVDNAAMLRTPNQVPALSALPLSAVAPQRAVQASPGMVSSPKEAKEKKPRKPRQKKKDVNQEGSAGPAGYIPQPQNGDKQRKTAIQHEVQNILAQSAHMAGIGQLIMNQANQTDGAKGIQFVADMSKGDSVTLGPTSMVQMPGSTQAFMMPVPGAQKATLNPGTGQGARLLFAPQQDSVAASGIKGVNSQHGPFMTNPFIVLPPSSLPMYVQNNVALLGAQFQGQLVQDPAKSAQDHTKISQNSSFSSPNAVESPSVRPPQLQRNLPSGPQSSPDASVGAAVLASRGLAAGEPSSGQNMQGVHPFLRNMAMPVLSVDSKQASGKARTTTDSPKAQPQSPFVQRTPDHLHESQNRTTLPNQGGFTSMASSSPSQHKGLIPAYSLPSASIPGGLLRPGLTSEGSPLSGLRRPNLTENNGEKPSVISFYQTSNRNETPGHPQYEPTSASASPSISDVTPKSVTDRPKFLDLSKTGQGKVESQRLEGVASAESRSSRGINVRDASNSAVPLESNTGPSAIVDNRSQPFKLTDKRIMEERTNSSQGSRTPPQLLNLNQGQGVRPFPLASSLGGMGSQLSFSLPYTQMGMDTRAQFAAIPGSNMGSEHTRYMEELMQRRFLEHQRMFGLPSFPTGQGNFDQGMKRNSFHQL